MRNRFGQNARKFPKSSFLTPLMLILVFLAISFWGCASGPDKSSSASRSLTFDSAVPSDEQRVDLEEISPELVGDWTQYDSLVLEFRATSSQRMNFKVYTFSESGEKFSRVLFHPYPNVWVRAAIPISMLNEPPKTGHDMAAVGNRSRPGYFLGLWGPFVPLTDVRAIGFEMENPIGSPSVEIRSIQLVNESPGDAILEGAPLVDKFGQFIHEDWPGKAKSIEDLKSDWEQENSALGQGDFDYCEYGGYKTTKAKATGFFRVEKVGEQWWFVDPDGHLFLSAGSDVIRTGMMTRSRDRQDFFEEIPPATRAPEYIRDGDPGVSFFSWNLMRRFGEDWEKSWRDFTIRRMDSWGLNTIANWSDPNLWEMGQKPYVIPLASWSTEVNYLGLPDVYSEEFQNLTDQRAKEQCAPRKDDPWLIGYFLANEPPFPQKELQTVDLILAGPETATRSRLEQWLADEDTEERRKEFIDEAFDRYVQITSAAVKKYDPNHLNLGMRGGGRPTDAEIRAARAFDVYSVNIYNYEVSAERVRTISELTGKPIIIGEFHFGTPGRGLAASLVQVKDLAERGKAYRYYVEQAFAMPELIGTHWFQWVDQPCTGRFDGENYNIGLVDVTDRPYVEMVNALKASHKRIHQVHKGELEPFNQKAFPH